MESVVNQHMKNSNFNVGVIIPPDAFKQPVVYSDLKASRDFNNMSHDIYTSTQNSKDINEKKTPKSVFIMLGCGALALCLPFIKKIWKK